MTSSAKLFAKGRFSWPGALAIPLLVALVLLIAGGVMLDRQSTVLSEQRARDAVEAEVALIRAKLEGNLNSNIQLVRGFVAALSTEPNMSDVRFSALAARLFAEENQLRSLSAAPDLIVSMAYPRAANTSVIGLDLRQNPEMSEAVFAARDTGQVVLTGPVELIQGGRAFIGRFPVFAETPSVRRFWGVVSALIDVERLYADSGLLDPDSDLDISLTRPHGIDPRTAPFFGGDLSGRDPVRAEIFLPSGSWEIEAVPKGGWSSRVEPWRFRLILLAAGALIFLPVVATGRLMADRQKHIQALRTREADLERTSHRLNLALSTSQVGVWELDLETEDETWDERTFAIYGLPDNGERPTLESWRSAIHPEDREQAEAEFAQLLEQGKGSYQSDYRVVTPGGIIRNVRSIASLHQYPDGSTRVVGVNWDVTHDIRLQEDLRRAHQLTEARNRELEAARSRIEYTALHDSLTGLPNRRYLDQILMRHAPKGLHKSGSLALLHMDLDRFKQINDTLGHAAGDAMLIHAAGVLQSNVREGEFVARIGGDEFVAVSSLADGRIYLASLAERIVREMQQPVLFEGHECRFGVSIGIAAEEGQSLNPKQLLVNADIALYRAKARGRNCFEFFSTSLQAEVVQTKRIADEILKGLERDEFVPFYQPQFDARTLDVVGVEALVRWNHPHHGIKAPDSFLAVAEDLNVVPVIDRIMLEQSLAALRRWDEMGLAVPRASVNVSLRRLHDRELISKLKQLDITPGRIAFELVESIYLDERDDVVSWNIEQIKELGIEVEIDDFGTGYASIVSLQNLRPKRLKIDRQLVAPILTDTAQRRLLRSIIDIGKSMGIELIAEGVETRPHARMLSDMGIDILQGYAFSKPLSAGDLEAFLQEQTWRKAS